MLSPGSITLSYSRGRIELRGGNLAAGEGEWFLLCWGLHPSLGEPSWAGAEAMLENVYILGIS